MPIHVNDIHLFRFCGKELFHLDKCLPMGCSLSCSLFERFSSCLQQALCSKFSSLSVSHILEDFIFISPACFSLYQQHLSNFLALSSYAGIPIKASRTIPSSTSVPIHGILVDTILMLVHIPWDKLDCLNDLVSSFSHKRSSRLKLWQSLVGHLSFACNVVSPGCPSLRCMFNLMRGHTNTNHFVKIPAHMCSNCLVWYQFLGHFNGISILAPLVPLVSLHLQFYSDASSWGCAAAFGSRWFHLSWPSNWKSEHISVLEFVPVLLALDT